jgi:hypothetical protein
MRSPRRSRRRAAERIERRVRAQRPRSLRAMPADDEHVFALDELLREHAGNLAGLSPS